MARVLHHSGAGRLTTRERSTSQHSIIPQATASQQLHRSRYSLIIRCNHSCASRSPARPGRLPHLPRRNKHLPRTNGQPSPTRRKRRNNPGSPLHGFRIKFRTRPRTLWDQHRRRGHCQGAHAVLQVAVPSVHVYLSRRFSARSLWRSRQLQVLVFGAAFIDLCFGDFDVA